MRRHIYILFIFPFFSFIQAEKEIPSKIYYKDEKYVHIWSFNIDNDIYPDTAIFINSYMNVFNFVGDSKNLNIYFDKQFKTLAVTMKLNKNDKTLHYKRYDRKGVLRMEYFKENNEYDGFDKAWYSNGNIKFKWYYEKGKHICDTSYYITGEIKESITYFYSKTFKEKTYYKNGKISSELFWKIPEKENTLDYSDNSPILEIDYDSISGFPNLYYLNDTDIVSYLNDGSEVMTRTYRKIRVDSTVINRNK